MRVLAAIIAITDSFFSHGKNTLKIGARNGSFFSAKNTSTIMEGKHIGATIAGDQKSPQAFLIFIRRWAMDFVMLDFVVSDLKELLVDRAKAIGVLSDLVRDIEGAAWGAIAPVQEELIPFFLESRAMQYRAWKSSVSKDLDNRENEILARLGEFQTESAKVRKGN